MSTPIYYGNQWNVQSYTSGTTTVVPGLNIGAPSASGVAVLFTVPSGSQDKYFTVSFNGNTNGTVSVSGVSPNTINGATTAVSISSLTSKSFYNNSGTNWISF